MSTPDPRIRTSPADGLGTGADHDPSRERARDRDARRHPRRGRDAARALMVCGALALASGTAWADAILLRPSRTHFDAQGDANAVLVTLVNEAALQGLQFRLDYDPAVARPVAVAGLGRLADARQLSYRIEPGAIRVLVCDLTATRTPVGPGDGPIVSVTFELLASAGSDTLRVSARDGLGVTESLTAQAMTVNRIAVPVLRSTEPGDEPVSRRAGAAAGSGSDATATGVPARFALLPAGPNPFVSGTTVGLDVPRTAHVRVAVYDARGGLVRVLSDGVLEAGRHTVQWDGATGNGKRAGAGLFFVRMAAEGSIHQRKIVALQ